MRVDVVGRWAPSDMGLTIDTMLMRTGGLIRYWPRSIMYSDGI